MRRIRVALSQFNATVGDIDGNAAKIIAGIRRALDCGADVVAFPELAITGYPPEDLLLKPRFIEANIEAVHEVAKHVPDNIVAIVGFVNRQDDLYNAAAILHNGELIATYHKVYLLNYGVFDEDRYFQAGQCGLVFIVNGMRVGVTICEDIWFPGGPLRIETLEGDAELIVNISASPYQAGKQRWREKMLAVRAGDNLTAIAYVNLVGGQDELVFDGGSIIVNERGELIARANMFEDDFTVADIDLDAVFAARLHDARRRRAKLTQEAFSGKLMTCEIHNFKLLEPKPQVTPEIKSLPDEVAEVYKALVVGTRDYLHKNGFKQAVVGLSGGIDSSLTACIAADALGPENVIGVSMPGPYSSRASLEDAQQLAANLGIRFLVIPINDAFEAFLRILSEAFRGTEPDITEENIQARIRGVILMALSNKFGWLVLTTGNKSEASVGYCTLYGDTAGGFGVIKDVPKTMVYELARYKNEKEGREIIPRRVFEKPPSAELRLGQTDQDALPPYDVLDQILQAYVEEGKSMDEITTMGFDRETVGRVIRMVHRSEYKRRQVPPGTKVSPRALGKDRRLPITNRFEEWRSG